MEQFPKSLPFQGSVINQAGIGRVAGSINYVNQVTGQSLDLFRVQVVQVGPIFALGAVAGNEALGRVRVDHTLLNGSGPAQLGDALIIGPLEFLPAGPRAMTAWTRALVPNREPARPAPVRIGTFPINRTRPDFVPRRKSGAVTRVAPTGGVWTGHR